jgi:hypothetical protein
MTISGIFSNGDGRKLPASTPAINNRQAASKKRHEESLVTPVDDMGDLEPLKITNRSNLREFPPLAMCGCSPERSRQRGQVDLCIRKRRGDVAERLLEQRLLGLEVEAPCPC